MPPRKPPPHRRPRDPFRKAQRAPQIRQPGPSPLAEEMRGHGCTEERPCAKCTPHIRDLGYGEFDDFAEIQAVMHGEWVVDHPGIGRLAYDTEDEARVAAGTAGTLLHWGQEVT